VRLLDRAGGKVIPTAAGQALVGPARRAQAAADDAVAATAEHRRGDTGRVRLGTDATACIHLLPPVLAAVRQAMPGLEVTVTIGNTADVLPQLEAGDLDVALVTLPVPAGRVLSTTRLLSDPLVALLPEADAPAGDAPVTAAQPGGLPLILYEAGGNTRAVTDAWFRRAGITPRPVMELDSVEAIKTLVGSGLGAALLPADLVPSRPGSARGHHEQGGQLSTRFGRQGGRDPAVVATGFSAQPIWGCAGLMRRFSRTMPMHDPARLLAVIQQEVARHNGDREL